MVRPAAEPQPRKLLRAYGANHRPRAVVAPSAAVRMNANRAQGQLHFIPHHQQCVHIQFVLGEQLSYGVAAQVHVRLRLGQSYIFSGDLTPAHQRLALRPPDANPMAIRQFVHDHESQVVRRPLVLRVRIPKSDNEPHSLLSTGRSSASLFPQSKRLLFFLLLRLLGFLCFFGLGFRRLGTFFALHFLLALLDDFGLSGCRSFRLPSISSLTSMRNSVGMSLGRHSTSTSRVTTSKTPPCTFTPAGSPNVCTGTFTFMRTSIATRMRSTCRSFPVMGSTSQSSRMAGSGLPPNFT